MNKTLKIQEHPLKNRGAPRNLLFFSAGRLKTPLPGGAQTDQTG